VGRLRSGSRFLGRIKSGVRVSASFQIFALRFLLMVHSAIRGRYFRGFSLRRNLRECIQALSYALALPYHKGR